MAARTGAQYIAGLADDRAVWFGDKKVRVCDEPLFAGSIGGVAGYFDWQHKYADDCLVDDGDNVMPASLIVPRTKEDLARRHRCFDRVARYSSGMMGRTPDYVNATLAGFVARSDVFEGSEDKNSAARLKAFYREVVDGDLAMTHTIVQPAIDKSIGDVAGLNGELALRVVDRTKRGVVVRGAKILATLGPFSDELFVYPGGVQLPKDGRDYALMFSIPLSTKGVIQICRDHYDDRRSVADAPFSSRFDEQDSFVIFDDVEIPHERLFINGDVETHNGLIRAGWAANLTQQTTIRAAVKLEFAYELGTKMAKITNSENRPEVAGMLGEILQYARLARAAIRAAEADAFDWGNGAFFPDDRHTRPIRALMPSWMVRTNDLLIQMGSHNLLATPSIAAFQNPEMKPLLERYLPGAGGVSAVERAQIFRTAWDFVGSALGGRIALYERFYLASQHRAFSGDHMVAQRTEKRSALPDFLQSSNIA